MQAGLWVDTLPGITKVILNIDGALQYHYLSANSNAADLKSSTKGRATSGSVEADHSFGLSAGLILEPQVQLKIAKVEWNNFNDSINQIAFNDTTYTTARIGLCLEKTIARNGKEFKPWIYLGVSDELNAKKSNVRYAKHAFATHTYGTIGTLRLGATAMLSDSLSLYEI